MPALKSPPPATSIKTKNPTITAKIAAMRHRPEVVLAIAQIKALIVEGLQSYQYQRPQSKRLSKGFGEQDRYSSNSNSLVAEEASILQHIAEAQEVSHPSSSSTTCVDDSLRGAAKWTVKHKGKVRTMRRARMKTWTRIIKSMEPLSRELTSLMPSHVRLAAGHLKLGILVPLIPAIRWPDVSLLDNFVQGFAYQGDVPDSGVFRVVNKLCTKPWSLDPAVRKSDNMAWNKKLEDLLHKSSNSATAENSTPDQTSSEDAHELYRNTLQECADGTLIGPLSKSALDKTFGRGKWRSMKRFGVRQGNRMRSIDNAASNQLNAATSMHETIACERADFPVVCAQLYQECCDDMESQASDDPTTFAPRQGAPATNSMEHGTEDLARAYRQIPNDDPSYMVCAVWNPDAKKVDYFWAPGMLFGLKSAPTSFNRLPELLVMASRLIFGITASHYFDDYSITEPDWCEASGQEVLIEMHKQIGFSMAEHKHEPLAEKNVFLGSETDFSTVAQDGFIRCRPKEGRVKKILKILSDILDSGLMSPATAASVRGKLQFTLSTAYGRVGRAALSGFVSRQYSASDSSELTDDLRACIEFFLELLPKLPDKKIPISAREQEPPLLVWSDASYEYEKDRNKRVGRLGFVVYDPRTKKFTHASLEVPEHVYDDLTAKDQHITQLELLAACAVYESLPELQTRQVIHWIDNVAAMANLINGYSGKSDSARLVNWYHITRCTKQLDIWCEYVRSAANVADLPSRNEFKLLHELGSTAVPMRLPAFGEFSCKDLMQ